jgi:hypothetical protein
MRPARQRAQQEKDEHNQEDGSERHGSFSVVTDRTERAGRHRTRRGFPE